MRSGIGFLLSIALGFVLVSFATGQSTATDKSVPPNKHAKKTKQGRTAGGDVASGSGNIAAGAGKGAGHAAEGLGKGAADLATLHPIDATSEASKGGVSAGKDVTIGTGKGAAKIVKGIGKGVKHIF